jgi:hypothetical protein
MQYTKYMKKCSEQLIKSSELESDVWIKVLVEIQNICSEANEIFSLYDVENCETNGDMIIQTLINGFSDRLSLLSASLPAEGNPQLARKC